MFFWKLFHRRSIGVVDHFKKFFVRKAGQQVYRVKIRLLNRRAVVAACDGVGKYAALKFTGFPVAIKGDFWTALQAEKLRKNPCGTVLSFHFYHGGFRSKGIIQISAWLA